MGNENNNEENNITNTLFDQEWRNENENSGNNISLITYREEVEE